MNLKKDYYISIDDDFILNIYIDKEDSSKYTYDDNDKKTLNEYCFTEIE